MTRVIGKKIGSYLFSLIAIVSLTACELGADDPNNTAITGDTPIDEQTMVEEVGTIAIDLRAEGREFYLDGEEEANPTIFISQGSTVELTLCVTGGRHDWVVDEFDVATAQIGQDDECSMVEFTADQTGEFEYYCSVGNHREEGMYGAIVVE